MAGEVADSGEEFGDFEALVHARLSRHRAVDTQVSGYAVKPSRGLRQLT